MLQNTLYALLYYDLHITNHQYTRQFDNFYYFYKEYDQRRNLNFIQTFPELEYFYNANRPN